MPPLNPTIIMAAGMGSRMRADSKVSEALKEEARNRPKAMVRIGTKQRPLLEHILLQLSNEGCGHACIVISDADTITEPHFRSHPPEGMALSFVVQRVPQDRNKPRGTAEAVEVALAAHPEWEGEPVTVGNGDNLPPKGMFETLFAHACALPAFHPHFLGLPAERIGAFAVLHADGEGRLTGITEKPGPDAMAEARWSDGETRVSMNYFRMPYSDLRDAVHSVPEHPVRKERELPVAISRWIEAGGQMEALSMAGAFLDLTHPEDIEVAGSIVDAGGFALESRT